MPPPCGRWTGRQRLRAAEALREASPLLRRISPRALRSLLTPYWAAGWCGRDVLYAIDHQPDGTPWSAYDIAELRNPASFVAWRLRSWLTTDGEPLPSRSFLIDLEAAERRRREEARREAFRAAVEARADHGTGEDGHPAARAVRAMWGPLRGRASERRTAVTARPVDPPAFTEPTDRFATKLQAAPVIEDSEIIRARALARARAERQRSRT